MRFVTRAVLMIGCCSAAGCGASGTPGTGIATNPPPGASRAGGTASAAASGTRTVLTPLGLNIHATSSKDAARLGSAAQGTVLTVLDARTDTANNPWLKVQGASILGWISGDASLTSPRHFAVFPQDQHDFSVLYLDTWAFAEQGSAVVFRPQSGGTQTIAVTTAADDAALGPAGRNGYRVTTFDATEVCGVTTTLRHYDRVGSPAPIGGTGAPTGGTSASAAPGAAPALPELAHLAQIRVPVDATHTLGIEYAYDDIAQVSDFDDFVNSLSFPAPLCRGAAPTPTAVAPSPT